MTPRTYFRRRIGAAGAALALVAASVVAGAALSASAAEIPAQTSALETTAATVTLTGETSYIDAGFTITVTDDAGPPNLLCTTTTDVNGDFECPGVSVAPGANTFHVHSQNPGVPSDFADNDFSVTRYLAPTIKGIVGSTVAVTAGPTVTLEGTGPETGDIVLDIYDVNNVAQGASCTTSPDATGAWTCASSANLLPGDYTAIAGGYGPIGTYLGESAAFAFTVEPNPATAITITSPVDADPDPQVLSATTLITGTVAPANADVQVWSQNQHCNATVTGTSWTCSIDFVQSQLDTVIEAYNSLGTLQASVVADVVLPPTINGLVGGYLYGYTADYTVTGVVGLGATVHVEANNPDGECTVTETDNDPDDVPGTFECPIEAAAGNEFADNTTYTMTVAQTLGGIFNSRSVDIIVDRTPGAVITTSFPAVITDPSVVVSGTTDYASGTLDVYGAGSNCSAPITGTTAPFAWSCTLDNLYSTENADITVQRTLADPVLDAATVDVVMPPSFGNTDDSGNPIGYGNPVGLTGGGIQSYSGEPATVVTATVSGPDGPLTCTSPTSVAVGEGSGGDWSCTLPGTLPDGGYPVSITQTPPWSGGVSSQPNTRTLWIDSSGNGTRDVLGCSFSAGALTITKSGAGNRVALYAVAPGTPDYTPDYAGTCSGGAGTASPGAFNDVFAGDCSPSESEPQPWLVQTSELGCLATGLTPGLWNLYYSADSGSVSWDWFFTVPSPPTVAGAATPEPGVAHFGGTGTPGNTITVLTLDGDPVCTAVVTGSGAWSCNADVGASSRQYSAIETDAASGGVSPETDPTATLVILGPVDPPTQPATDPVTDPVTPPAVLPPAPVLPLTWLLTMTGVDGPLHPGQTIGLSSKDLPPGSVVDAELHSTPTHLGSTVVRPDGSFDLAVTIPMDVEPGKHKIIVTVTAPGQAPSPIENNVVIVIEGKSAAGNILHGIATAGLGIGLDGENPRNDPNSPTGITGSVPTLFDILTSPGSVGIAAGLALVILLLVALPTEILNSTIEANTSRFGRVFAAIQHAIDTATEWFIRVTRTPLVATVVLLLLTSVIFGFVDPGFGFDLASLRLVLSLALALFVITFVASSLTGLVVRRRWSLESTIGMQPTALLFAVLGVVVARLLDFSPGFLIGLVIGIELAHRATERQRVRTTIIEFSIIVGFGVLAWLAYSTWVALQGDADLGFWGGLLQDALVAVTSEGLTAVTIAMIPVAFLDGRAIFEHSKRLWVGMFLVVAAAFSLLVLPTALAGQEIANIVAWVAALIGFAVITLGVTVWMRRTGRSVSSDAHQKVDA